MGNHLDIEGYVSELIGKPKVELDSRDKKFLIELLESPKSVYRMTEIINLKFEFKPSMEEDDDSGSGSGSSNKPQATDAPSPPPVFYCITSGPLSSPAVLKRIRKLVRYGLIENVDKESLTDRERFNVNLHRAKLFTVTEYGLFCMLSQLLEYEPTSLFWRYWRYKVIRVLLSSYFEKKTVIRPRKEMYFTIVLFLTEAHSITTRRLSEIEDAIKEDNEKEKQEQIRRLEDDLLWHAKSFALRLMVDAASRKGDDDDYHRSRRLILSNLAHDKKFYKLTDTAVREILSYYKGGRLLRRK